MSRNLQSQLGGKSLFADRKCLQISKVISEHYQLKQKDGLTWKLSFAVIVLAFANTVSPSTGWVTVLH